MTVQRLFFKERHIEVLKRIGVKPQKITQIARMTSYGWSPITNLVKSFEKAGIVTKEKKGREKIVILTENGERLLELINKIEEIKNE